MKENWGLLGHQWAVELLKGHLRKHTSRHAYLFTGPSGVGRRTLALRFAQALNAEDGNETGEFDPQARASQQFEQMTHPDLSIIRRLEGDRDIKIDAVREIQRSLILAPYAARYRIALLLNFEEANENAQNALLKTLEEPGPRVILMVTAESAESLLPTISSRCEILRLRPVSLDIVAAGLEEQWGVPQQDANILAHISGGRPGYAVHLFQNPEQLAQRTAWLDDCRRLMRVGKVDRFSYAANITKDKNLFQQVLQVWLSYWRDILIQSTEAQIPITNLDRAQEIRELSAKVRVEQARSVVVSLEKTIGLMKTNTNPRLAAEVLLLDIPNI